jgi:hypothetical protein
MRKPIVDGENDKYCTVVWIDRALTSIDVMQVPLAKPLAFKFPEPTYFRVER